ncbi:hypothetical protein ACQR16_04130 [Bradyrhizobium oligotrophicum]|uniref:hypothetical protein n=1 Tax=Bradyrhizobium oligotrophicum TaxID=44255 RepID=UPI003EB8C148
MNALPARADGVPLGFRLSPFCRTAWVSDAARAQWQPKLAAIETSLEDLAVLAARDAPAGLTAAVRPCSLDRLRDLAAHHAVGLTTRPINPALIPHATARGLSGRMLVQLRPACSPQQGEVDGGMRDPCCGHPAAGWSSPDPIWQTATATPTDCAASHTLHIPCTPLANPLLAPLGLMLSLRWPCCFGCPTAAADARALIALGSAHGHADTMALLEHILSWPMSWTALHGIAEIKTPVFRLVRDTVATGELLRVDHDGGAMPDHAARGLGHPFRTRAGSRA